MATKEELYQAVRLIKEHCDSMAERACCECPLKPICDRCFIGIPDEWPDPEEGSDCNILSCRKQLAGRLAAYEKTGLEPEEVAHYAKAKTEGRLVVLPCKVGDTYYTIRKFCDMGGNDDFGEHSLSDCEYCCAPECKHEKRIVEGVFFSVESIVTRAHIGKHYLTREAAEAALRKEG